MITTSRAADQDLQCRVQRFLESQSYPALQRLQVKVEDGVVRVTGRVRSFYEKQLAISCVRRVAEVRQLDVEVEVQPELAGK